MSSSEPRIAVVGAGNWGRNHVRTWAQLGHLAAVCDASDARLADVAEQHPGVGVTANVEDIFADPAIDGVVLASPAVTHAELAIRALDAGKDVLVEKPMATTLDDAEKLAAHADATDRLLMVGHVLEFHPAFLKVRELLESGALGRLLYIYSNRLNFGTIRTEENALWSFAPHDMALLLRLVGSAPQRVVATGGAYLSPDVADTTLMSLEFAGNVHAHVYVSWLHPFKEHRFVVIGDRQMAVVDDSLPWAEKLQLYPHSVDWKAGRVPVASRADAQPVPLVEKPPLAAECEHFAECIRTRQRPLTDASSGIDVLRLLEAGSRSLGDGGHPVELL